MVKVDFDVGLPIEICDHFERLAERAGVSMESYISDIVTQNLRAAVEKMEAEHGI